MLMKPRYIALSTLLSTLLLVPTVPALAADKPAPSPWKASASLSYIIENGNSSSRAVYGKASASYQWTKWKVGGLIQGGSTRSKSDITGDMERTSEEYYAELREERKITENDYLYNLTTFKNDNFSGYQYTLTDSIGYGRQLIATDTQSLTVVAGPGYRQRKLRYPLPSDEEIQRDAMLHLGAEYHWQITESTAFSQTLQDDIVDSDDSTIRSETALTTMLNSHLAFKVSYLMTHHTQVPDYTHNTDSKMILSLEYTYK